MAAMNRTGRVRWPTLRLRARVILGFSPNYLEEALEIARVLGDPRA